MRRVGGHLPVLGWALHLRVVLHDHAVEQHCHIRRAYKRLALEAWTGPDDVVALPLAWCTASIDQRRILAIDRPGGAIRVGRVIVTIKHLDLVKTHQEHTAIAASLAIAFDDGRCGKLKVQLAIAEDLTCLNVTGTRNNLHIAVLDLPARLSAGEGLPAGEIGAIE